MPESHQDSKIRASGSGSLRVIQAHSGDDFDRINKLGAEGYKDPTSRFYLFDGWIKVYDKPGNDFNERHFIFQVDPEVDGKYVGWQDAGSCFLSLDRLSGSAAVNVLLVSAQYRRCNVATGCMFLIFEDCFDGMGMYRISANVYSGNRVAREFYDKWMVREGVERKARMFKNRRMDIINYGVLRPEWKQIKKRFYKERPDVNERLVR